ncbi:hypothetical protein GCM10011391_39650 [Pullulanibacillus camelliae]|uniref:Uncharacterized protein n=1 Tax=Pullulanibacillus camelliae TaxID=1707096 RepID=A0A8J2YP31_9BACL|nr:hypothetical protein GCM10011391_39650 [Pullulanibacillus camelliae]
MSQRLCVYDIGDAFILLSEFITSLTLIKEESISVTLISLLKAFWQLVSSKVRKNHQYSVKAYAA